MWSVVMLHLHHENSILGQACLPPPPPQQPLRMQGLTYAVQPVHSQQQHQKHHGARTLQATAYNASAAANAAANNSAISPPDNNTMHHCKRNHDSMGKQDSVVESKRPRSVSQLVQPLPVVAPIQPLTARRQLQLQPLQQLQLQQMDLLQQQQLQLQNMQQVLSHSQPPCHRDSR